MYGQGQLTAVLNPSAHGSAERLASANDLVEMGYLDYGGSSKTTLSFVEVLKRPEKQ